MCLKVFHFYGKISTTANTHIQNEQEPDKRRKTARERKRGEKTIKNISKTTNVRSNMTEFPLSRCIIDWWCLFTRWLSTDSVMVVICLMFSAVIRTLCSPSVDGYFVCVFWRWKGLQRETSFAFRSIRKWYYDKISRIDIQCRAKVWVRLKKKTHFST